MTFPPARFDHIGDYLDGYMARLSEAAAAIDRSRLAQAEAMLLEAIRRDGQVFSCGNGGSAAIANHMVCDHAKGVQTDTGLKPRIQSLSATVEFITAIANDIDYAEIFAYQLATFARPGDVLITISSSGDSENVVRAIQWAKANRVGTIAFTGFAGGRSAQLADVNLHVPADNYGVIEDLHQSLMHVLAQFLRQINMPPEMVGRRRF